MSKIRTEFSFEPQIYHILDSIAAEHGFELAPPYAARAKRKWDWGAAVEYLALNHSSSQSAVDESLELVASFVDGLLVGNGECRYVDSSFTLVLGDEVYKLDMKEEWGV